MVSIVVLAINAQQAKTTNNKSRLSNAENTWLFHKSRNRIRPGTAKKPKHFKLTIVDVNYGCFNHICKKIAAPFDGDRQEFEIHCIKNKVQLLDTAWKKFLTPRKDKLKCLTSLFLRVVFPWFIPVHSRIQLFLQSCLLRFDTSYVIIWHTTSFQGPRGLATRLWRFVDREMFFSKITRMLLANEQRQRLCTDNEQHITFT